MRRLEPLAAAALALVLVVVVASAAIRLGAQEPALGALRIAHRSAASLEVLVLAALVWLAWRARRAGKALGLACALTLGLSLIGLAAGQNPPFAASMGNILGGLALAATFAWLAGAGNGRRPHPLMAFLALQCVIGAWLSLSWKENPIALLAGHALLGVALVLGVAWLALRLERPAVRLGLTLLALAVPASGVAAALLDGSFLAALAHAAAVALLVAAVAFVLPRGLAGP